MRLSLRFILPLVLILSVIAYAVVPVVDDLTLKWFTRDLELRGDLITRSLLIPLHDRLKSGDPRQIKILLEDFAQDERLLAVGFCDEVHHALYKTSRFPEGLNCKSSDENHLLSLKEGLVHFASKELSLEGGDKGKLLLIHDMSFVQRRSESTRQLILGLFLILAIVISLLTVLIAQLSWRGWVSGIRSLIRGDNIFSLIGVPQSPELRPVAKDLRMLVRDLERERKIRDELNQSWNPQALKNLLQKELSGDEILILSNREPYIHNKKNGNIVVQVPASGLVTALEPIMRACSGTWIAHGSGTADREVVDKNDHVQVPPARPAYQIRRVWLTKEEERGYYYGFSNEGLWPLCHIAHTRPTFRSADWAFYHSVNRKFSDAVVSEARTENPVILIQDYHFALAPKMIREKLPKATIITFWHIPWPNAESFGICPWREEIIEGLLGSSILGFHTRFHCHNFLDSADRFLECRIDRDTSTISYGKKLTTVNAYPISIEWPPRWMGDLPSVLSCRSQIREINNIATHVKLGIGVDRLDYTKGILERFMAVERLLELYPEYIGSFTFIQIGAPTRSAITQYQHFESDVRDLARQINTRFGSDTYVPIILLPEHHEPQLVFEYFRGADLCFVSSLHDGMNLVAKEFVAARDDEEGILILSQFAGASKELPEALIVNPYNIDQCANALATALRMPIAEQKERMRNMRGLIQEHNVFRWAGKMLIDAARMRQRNRIERRYPV
jgi:trehalose 6-phosphate synthase